MCRCQGEETCLWWSACSQNNETRFHMHLPSDVYASTTTYTWASSFHDAMMIIEMHLRFNNFQIWHLFLARLCFHLPPCYKIFISLRPCFMSSKTLLCLCLCFRWITYHYIYFPWVNIKFNMMLQINVYSVLQFVGL